MIGDFHFIRPGWLLAILPIAALWWLMYRRQDAATAWRGIIAPHLLPYLLKGQNARRRFSPLVLIGIGWVVTVLAIAGPTWQREPAPFADDTAALAIVVKVSPSMMTEDVSPSRLGRSVLKIHDVLQQRRGAKTMLIAYAGTAHVVMPLTTDGGIIDTFAQSLDPKIMPTDGDAATEALKLADQALAGGGSILWITDSIAAEQAGPLAAWRKQSRTPVRFLPPLLAGGEFDAVSNQADSINASVIRLAADDSDVMSISRAARFAPVKAAGTGDRWQESGYWLTPLLLLLALPFFRRGWMSPTVAKG